MGVRGLTTYIACSEDQFLKDFSLHNTNLVIDGHSLCAQLYRSLHSFSAFGGDYDKVAAYTKRFFQSLRKCNVTPYVIFDGGHEKRKLKTAYGRLRSKLSGASRLYPGNQTSLQIFPLLLRDVFKEVLTDAKIPFTVCEFEADDEIAAMARHLNCPVLSYDSDFFIYNVLYIPFPTLSLKPTVEEQDGEKIQVMDCKLYKVQYFVDQFGGLKEELLPLFATLLGNDYVEKRVFKNFFSHLKMPKSRKKKNEQQRNIQGLLDWLRNESLESAVIKILGRLKKGQKQHVLAIINKTCQGYHRKNCTSLKYFNIAEADNTNNVKVFDDVVVDSEDDGSDAASESSSDSSGEDSNEGSIRSVSDTAKAETSLVPDWFALAIRRGLVPQSYINLYTHQLYFCSPQAEDYTEQDSFLSCLRLLKYAFDMLNNFSDENLTYVSRESTQYKRIIVGSEFATSRLCATSFSPLAENLQKLPQWFEHFIKENMPLLNQGTIEELPSSLQLFMIAVLWWARHCSVTVSQVYSLLLCYTMLEVVDDKTGYLRGDYYFNNKYAKKLEEIRKRPKSNMTFDESQLFLNKNKVAYEDCLIACSALLKCFEMDNEIKKHPKTYDNKIIHSFAQFQCCLQQFNYLNTLCNNRYESTKFSKSYNGTFVYNICNKLCNRDDLFSLLDQYLNGADSVLLFFKSLCCVYENCVKDLGLVILKSVGKRRGRRKKRGKDVHFQHEEFESEVII